MISVRAISLANKSTTRPLTATLNTRRKYQLMTNYENGCFDNNGSIRELSKMLVQTHASESA